MPVKESDPPVLSMGTPPLYHWAVGLRIDGGLVDALRPGYRQVAAGLREQILSGKLPAGSAIDGYSIMARNLKVSQATISAAVNQLADEGLVRIEHGKQTIVLARRKFRVAVEIARPEDDGPRDADALTAALTAAAAAEPAVSAIESARVLRSSVEVIAIVTASSPARAGTIAESLVWSARGQWSWDGFDLAWSTVTAAPAGEA
jgi:DNA-binding transcriptional regulator YhcF (GntR family)